ncbi:MAG TPA: hypothetical protein VJY34_16320 [Roseiarcus sp.]|nr:hypothetical protein [Roseiarcus sp.]
MLDLVGPGSALFPIASTAPLIACRGSCASTLKQARRWNCRASNQFLAACSHDVKEIMMPGGHLT